MLAKDRAKFLRKYGISDHYDNHILIEFVDFLQYAWSRLCLSGEISILDTDGTYHTYYDYASATDSLTIAQEIDISAGSSDINKISNMTLQLNNANNLIATILADCTLAKLTLNGSRVNIYNLLYVGGTLKKSHAELIFSGIVDLDDTITWDESQIEIPIVSDLDLKDKNILHTKLTKKVYPNIDDSCEDEYLPIVGGNWAAMYSADGWAAISNLPAVGTPAYCVDTTLNKYIFADHPVSNAYDLIRERIPCSTADSISSLPTKSQHIWMYNDDKILYLTSGEVTPFDDTLIVNYNLSSIIVPGSKSHCYTFVKPSGISDSVTNVNLTTQMKHAIDDDGYLDTGLSMITKCNWLTSYGYKDIRYTFDDVNLNLQKGAYVDNEDADDLYPKLISRMIPYAILPQGSSISNTKLSLIITSPGTGWKYLWIEELTWRWTYEDDTKSIYRIRMSNTSTGEIYSTPADQKFYRLPTGGASRIVFNSDYIISGCDLYTSLSQCKDASHYYSNVALHITDYEFKWHDTLFPTQSTYTSTAVPAAEFTSTLDKGISLEPSDLSKWEYGIKFHLDSNAVDVPLRAFGLLIAEIPFEAGLFTPHVPKYVTAWRLGVNKDKRHSNVISYKKENDKYATVQELAEDISEIENVADIYVQAGGYTADNTATGAIVNDPADHFIWLIEQRQGLTTDDYDSDTFDAFSDRRKSAIGSAYSGSWNMLYCITQQSSLSEVLGNLAWQNNAAIVYDAVGKYNVYDLDTFDSTTIAEKEIIDISENDITAIDLEHTTDIYDSFELKYRYSNATGDYLSTLRVTPFTDDTSWYSNGDTYAGTTISDNTYDVSGYSYESLRQLCYNCWSQHYKETDSSLGNLHTLELECDAVHDIRHAKRLMVALIKRFTQQKLYLSVTVNTSTANDMHLLSIISVYHPVIGNRKNYIVVKASKDIRSGTTKLEMIEI